MKLNSSHCNLNSFYLVSSSAESEKNSSPSLIRYCIPLNPLRRWPSPTPKTFLCLASQIQLLQHFKLDPFSKHFIVFAVLFKAFSQIYMHFSNARRKSEYSILINSKYCQTQRAHCIDLVCYLLFKQFILPFKNISPVSG